MHQTEVLSCSHRNDNTEITAVFQSLCRSIRIPLRKIYALIPKVVYCLFAGLVAMAELNMSESAGRRMPPCVWSWAVVLEDHISLIVTGKGRLTGGCLWRAHDFFAGMLVPHWRLVISDPQWQLWNWGKSDKCVELVVTDYLKSNRSN